MRSAVCLFLLFWASVLSVRAQESDSNIVATIRALEREWGDAQSRNDNGSLNLIFDNDLVYVEYGKLVSKRDYLARIKHEPPVGDAIAAEVLTIKTFRNTALVVGTYRERLPGPGAREFKRWRFIDTWVYKNHTWVLAAAAATVMINDSGN